MTFRGEKTWDARGTKKRAQDPKGWLQVGVNLTWGARIPCLVGHILIDLSTISREQNTTNQGGSNMKKHNFRVMSDQKCRCSTPIKQSMVDRHPGKILDCFPCFRKGQASKGHEMTTAREVRTGLKRGRKLKMREVK